MKGRGQKLASVEDDIEPDLEGRDVRSLPEDHSALLLSETEFQDYSGQTRRRRKPASVVEDDGIEEEGRPIKSLPEGHPALLLSVKEFEETLKGGEIPEITREEVPPQAKLTLPQVEVTRKAEKTSHRQKDREGTKVSSTRNDRSFWD